MLERRRVADLNPVDGGLLRKDLLSQVAAHLKQARPWKDRQPPVCARAKSSHATKAPFLSANPHPGRGVILGRVLGRSWNRAVETLAWLSHSWALAISAKSGFPFSLSNTNLIKCWKSPYSRGEEPLQRLPGRAHKYPHVCCRSNRRPLDADELRRQ
jgi:hypothetical protein